jgi:hypothetical protein
MPAITIELDRTAYRRLVEQAAQERRPIGWQAEIELRRALGLPEYASMVVAAPPGAEAAPA